MKNVLVEVERSIKSAVENNMDENLRWIKEQRILKTIESLNSNNMNGYLVKDTKELISKIEEIVKKDSTVTCGGSMSLFETGVIDYLRSSDRYKFLDRYAEGVDSKEAIKIYKAAFTSDAYFTSSNAVTLDGQLYNVDGNGNRVSAMLYGPEKVIVVCGVNKIVNDLEAAIQKSNTITAPANARRLNRNTPCTKTGYCMDCSSEERICSEYTLIKRQGDKDRIHIIFLNEDIGY